MSYSMIDDNDISFVKSGKYRLKIMKFIRNNVLSTPNDISKSMDLVFSQVSRTLSELEEKNIVVCTTPSRTKGRIYRLTKNGNEIIKFLEAIKD